MTTFTNTLPADCDNSENWYFVWHTPDPDATTLIPAWKDKAYAPKLGPDPTRQRGTGHPVPATYLIQYYRMNQERGEKWSWMPMADFAALLAGQPEQGATGDGEVERLRELLAEAIMYLRNIGDSASSSADCIVADLKRLEGKG